MKRIFTLVLVSILFTGFTANAQWLITTTGVTSDTVTFDASFIGVNEGVFAGTGIEATPAIGQLNSNAWLFLGFSSGNTMYGGSYNSGDYAKGDSPGGEFSGGIYAFEVAAGDTALGIQPTGSDFTPGDMELKVVNTTGSAVDSVFVSYELWVNNDADRANSFNLSYSINGGTYVPVTALDYTSVETSQGSVLWVSNPMSTGLNLNLANNDTLLLRWSSADATGSGGRDEFAMDDIHVNFTAAAPVSSDTTKPEIVNAEFISASTLELTFSEPVTAASAQNIANYSFAPLSAVTNAVLSSSLGTVTLTLAPALVSGTLYTVNIMNIVDTSLNANMMDPVNGTFYFNSYTGTDLMITEIYHSQPSGGIQDIDYFELYNSSSSPISLAGMEITSGVNFTIDSNLIIPANGYLVFVENIDSFNLAFPSVTNVIEYDDGSLSGGGETITLSNTIGGVVASVDYQTSAPWPAYSNTEAIELCDLTTDYTDGMNWYVAGTVSSTVSETLYGTPGSANSCAAPPAILTYDIELLRTVDADGQPDSLDVYCAIEGIVYGKDMDGNAGYTFALIDDTRGITVHSFVDVDNYVVNQGDELRAVGTVKFYNGLTQFRVDSITVLSTGNCIEYPELVDEFDEMTESEAIYMVQVKLEDPTAWPAPGSNANLNIITMDDDTLLMRIDKDTKIADTITFAPSGYFNVSGIGSQFDGSSPYDEGYQIMPQFVADIDTVVVSTSDIFVNEVMVKNQTVIADPEGDYDSWIEIYNGTSSALDLTGYFIANDDTAYRFERCIAPVVVPANDYILLWADDEMQDGSTHLPLMLADTGVIGLLTNGGNVIDTLEWDSSLTDVSFGHNTDGSGVWVSFEESTPNATNSGGVILSVISANPLNALNVYPNPVSNGNITFNKVVSFNMYSVTGQLMMTRQNVNQLNVSELENGVYFISTEEGEIVKVIVK